MDTKRSFIVLVLVACLGGTLAGAAARPALGAEPDPRQAELTKTAEAFVAAFESGDAKAVAAFWAKDGDLVDVEGRVLKGREAIEQDFAELFRENKGLKVRIEVASVRFVGDTAIEDGTTTVLAPDGSAPSRARYTNVLAKKDGKWLIVSVRESPYVPPSNQERLGGLSWVIGEWADTATDGHVARVVFDWTPDKNFIVSLRAVDVNGQIMDNGTQRIGWDPAAKQIRSWNFEPDGGFGQGVWTKTGDKTWEVKSSTTLRSGHIMTATTTLTRVDAETVTFQVKDQVVDGKALADTGVVTMKRVK